MADKDVIQLKMNAESIFHQSFSDAEIYCLICFGMTGAVIAAGIVAHIQIDNECFAYIEGIIECEVEHWVVHLLTFSIVDSCKEGLGEIDSEHRTPPADLWREIKGCVGELCVIEIINCEDGHIRIFIVVSTVESDKFLCVLV